MFVLGMSNVCQGSMGKATLWMKPHEWNPDNVLFAVGYQGRLEPRTPSSAGCLIKRSVNHYGNSNQRSALHSNYLPYRLPCPPSERVRNDHLCLTLGPTYTSRRAHLS